MQDEKDQARQITKTAPLKRADGISPPTTRRTCDSGPRHDQRNALIAQDGCSYWLQRYPSKRKDAAATASCLRRCLRSKSQEEFALTFQVNSSKRVRTCNGHDTNTCHRSETHGIAERVVRRVTEGATTTMVQSGFLDWWDCAMECCSHLRNVRDKISQHARNIWCNQRQTLIPFRAWMSHIHISSKDESRLHPLGRVMSYVRSET